MTDPCLQPHRTSVMPRGRGTGQGVSPYPALPPGAGWDVATATGPDACVRHFLRTRQAKHLYACWPERLSWSRSSISMFAGS
ncbi:hypothetical protein Mth01_44600 [Sphaerimonospora thailandensis]|uniref:Uncharacterized protein n=1 Tax=Sphaerimonospora thailandensis TaxID=795644 RepID=A0A8J3RE71_9ACTN|nr:hypothetical protein Mth01_44600 [Sphaerimonospora thailandensis]